MHVDLAGRPARHARGRRAGQLAHERLVLRQAVARAEALHGFQRPPEDDRQVVVGATIVLRILLGPIALETAVRVIEVERRTHRVSFALEGATGFALSLELVVLHSVKWEDISA